MILLTGGCGFIGSAFVLDWLRQRDEPLANLDLLTYAGRRDRLAAVEAHPGYRFIHGDICDAALLAGLFQALRPRAVVHLAAESHVDRSISAPPVFIQTNVVGTMRLLEAALAYWQGLPAQEARRFRFLHVSTDEVFGSLGPADPAFTEDHPRRPSSPYAASKAAADHFAGAWSRTYGLPVLATNCSNNYGPRQHAEKLIPLMIRRALAGLPLPVYGDGLQVRDWLHVGDHCAALREVLERGRPGESYNIGGRSERTNLQVVHAVCAALDAARPRPDGAPYARQIRHVEDRPGHDRRYAIDDRKIAGELGWQPRMAFARGIRETVAWYLANPQEDGAPPAGRPG